MQIYTDPWPHIIIDDFYDDSVFIPAQKKANQIIDLLKNNRSLSAKDPNKLTIDLRHKKFAPIKNCIESRLQKVREEYFNIFLENYSVREHDKDKIDQTTEINAIRNLDYPIHDEAKCKILSVVTYIAPSNGKGTILYDKDKNFVKEVEWKPNRTLIFAPIDNVTWHSYKSEGEDIRFTMNSFIRRPDWSSEGQYD